MHDIHVSSSAEGFACLVGALTFPGVMMQDDDFESTSGTLKLKKSIQDRRSAIRYSTAVPHILSSHHDAVLYHAKIASLLYLPAIPSM